jgi:tetratricopeptide (TPR) repeat protein
MPHPVSPNRLSFEENVNALLEELALAERWQRPSILLAVHKSKFGQDRAEKALEEKLGLLGQKVSRLTIDKEHSDVPHLILATPPQDRPVFFVSNLDWGGGPDRGDAYRALNIYRELFVDNHLRVVFWLTTNEAASLPRLAPDFWAFRHRVIEFTGQRIPRKTTLPAGILLWDIQNSVDPYDTFEARIAVREQLLGKLPHNAEARSARLDLLYHLGYLYWSLGDAAQASEQFGAGLELATPGLVDPVATSVMNGLAVLAYERNEYERAAEFYAQGLEHSPSDPLLLMNLGATDCALGRNQDALALARKAVKVAPRDPRVWNAHGYIYASMGKFDDAIICFLKAVELNPRLSAYHLALAICYDLVERPDETRRELELARALARDQALAFLEIYEAALLGNPVKAQELARAAVQANRLSPFELRRDPGLSFLMEPSQLDERPA